MYVHEEATRRVDGREGEPTCAGATQAVCQETDPNTDAADFVRLSRIARGNSRGWKFNREELHERK